MAASDSQHGLEMTARRNHPPGWAARDRTEGRAQPPATNGTPACTDTARVAAALRPGGTLLLVEPTGHVGAQRFAAELRVAERAGLRVQRREAGIPRVRLSRATVLAKTPVVSLEEEHHG